jgi:DNA adenine methylase
MSERLRPILKWAGGKRSLVPRILKELPDHIETYYEPFVGGAAVFLALAEAKRFRRAVITDKNAQLINLYTVVRDDLGKLLKRLEALQGPNQRRTIITRSAPKRRARRSTAPRGSSTSTRPATMVCNRVNSKGGFNVPYGRYKRPKIYDPERLAIAALALQDVTIRVADFEEVCAEARKGDAVYLDPPYLPVSKTASFSAYHSEAFGLPEHQRLAKVFGKLLKRGVAAVLSNSATPETRELYRTFKCSDVSVRRPINSVASGRGAVSELLVVAR